MNDYKSIYSVQLLLPCIDRSQLRWFRQNLEVVNRKRKVWEFLVNVRSYLDKQMLIRWMNRWNKTLFHPSSTMEKAEIMP